MDQAKSIAGRISGPCTSLDPIGLGLVVRKVDGAIHWIVIF